MDEMDEEEWEGEEEWEEEEEEEEEEDSEDEMGPKRAFEVYGEPEEGTGPPADGEEYLRRVIAEAKGYPDVMTSDVNPRRFDDRRTSYVPETKWEPETNDEELHGEDDQLEILRDFAKLRLHIASMKRNAGGDDVEIEEQSLQENWENLLEGEPEARKLNALDQRSLGNLFLELVQKANGKDEISDNDSLWMYYILAFLDTPLNEQAEAAIKYLQDQCVRLQNQATGANAPTRNLYMIKLIAEKGFV